MSSSKVDAQSGPRDEVALSSLGSHPPTAPPLPVMLQAPAKGVPIQVEDLLKQHKAYQKYIQMSQLMFGKPDDTEEPSVHQFKNVATIFQCSLAPQSVFDRVNESLDTLLRPTMDILFVPASSLPAMSHDASPGNTDSGSN